MTNAYRDIDRRLAELEAQARKFPPMGYPAGSAFPTGTLSDGMLFYRTDADQLCRYNGTDARWYPEEGYGAAVARHLGLPALRAFWPLSAYSGAIATNDMAGLGLSLTNNAGSAALYGNRALYWDFNGSTAYLSRADETNLDLVFMTMGGWFWTDLTSTSQFLMAKWNGTTNNRSYELQLLSSGGTHVARVALSNDGTAFTVYDSTATIGINTWNHLAFRYTPSTEVTVFVNGVALQTTSSIPATIFNGNASFRIAATDDAAAANYFNGRAALCFICATGQGGFPNSVMTDLYRKTKLWFY